MILYILYYIFCLSLSLFIIYLNYKYFKIQYYNKFYLDLVENKKIFLTHKEFNKEFISAFKICAELYSISGIDCEWVNKQRVSLIQIGFPNGCCFLIRLLNGFEKLPDEVSEWLKNSNVIKFGVGIKEDSSKLLSDWGIFMRGCVDLRNLAVRLRNNQLDNFGLKSFSKIWLNIDYEHERDSKLLDQQCSDWEADTLSDKQLEYACLDALVGAFSPIEFLHRKLGISRHEAFGIHGDIKKYCQGCIDLKFKRINKNNENNNLKNKSKKYKPVNYARTDPIYDNSMLETPEGEMLSRLSKRKAEWYLKQGLATKICDEPLTVRLNFEPSGRASGVNDYYLQLKENKCVVCGNNSDGCVKKNVIPYEYRKYYPVSHKSHKSHDVIPLCIDCHRQSNIIDDFKKKELANIHDAPLGSRSAQINQKNVNVNKIKSYAKALLNEKNLPLHRYEELKQTIAEYLNIPYEDVIESYYQNIMNEKIEVISVDGEYVKIMKHGQKVVDTLKTQEDLVNFDIMWRQHFVDTMNPQFLPIGWAVDHRKERDINSKIEY